MPHYLANKMQKFASVIAIAILNSASGQTVAIGEGDTQWRLPTEQEISKLFELAIRKPKKGHYIAEITQHNRPWTEYEIEKEMAKQAEFSRINGQTRVPSKESLDIRRNNIKNAHDGVRVFNVQEWFSGSRHRLDINDDGIPWRWKDPTSRKEGTYDEIYIDLHDPSFSDFSRISMNNALRSGIVHRSPTKRFRTFDLWEANTMHSTLSRLVWSAAGRIEGRDGSVDLNYPFSNIETLELDIDKSKALQRGLDRIWSLRVKRSEYNGTPATLYLLKGISKLGLDWEEQEYNGEYWISEANGIPTLIQGTFTNVTAQWSVVDKREIDRKNPQLMTLIRTVTPPTAEILKRSASKQTTVVRYQYLDNDAKFNDASVFLPDFPEGYSISDISKGPHVYLEGHTPQRGIVSTPVTPSIQYSVVSRFIIIGFIAVISSIPLIIFVARKKR